MGIKLSKAELSVNSHLKPGEVMIDMVLVENADGSSALVRIVETCEGTWGKKFKVVPFEMAIFQGIFVSADGIMILEQLPIQRGPFNCDDYRRLRYDDKGQIHGWIQRKRLE
jgi:hypothetical protein